VEAAILFSAMLGDLGKKNFNPVHLKEKES
jgi:hypothetical protein